MRTISHWRILPPRRRGIVAFIGIFSLVYYINGVTFLRSLSRPTNGFEFYFYDTFNGGLKNGNEI